MLARGGAVLGGVFVKDRLQLRVNRTLAAIHHHHAVKGLVKRIELDFIVTDKRVARDAARLEVRLDVMPVDAGTADGCRTRAQALAPLADKSCPTWPCMELL